MKVSVETFLRQTLGIDIKVISQKSWARYCCPVHGETRPSCGTLLVYPYVTKCFACGYKASLPRFAAKMLRVSAEKANQMITNSVDITFNLEDTFNRDRVDNFIPSVVAEMYVQSFPGSLANKYVRWRKEPTWAANLFELGYDELHKALTLPMKDVNNGRVRGYSLVNFLGDFSDVTKNKVCEQANATVSTILGYRSYKSCVVVEGLFDAMRIVSLAGNGNRVLQGLCPVILNTAIPTDEQVRFIRSFDSITLALDHDDAGTRGREWLVKALHDRSMVFNLEYPEERKDPGEIKFDDILARSLVLQKNKFGGNKGDRRR